MPLVSAYITQRADGFLQKDIQETMFSPPTWWGAGSVNGGTGAGGVTGAAGLSLVEGPFQLPPPLDPAVLLTEVLEDLLWRREKRKKKIKIKQNVRTSAHARYYLQELWQY